MPHGQAVPAEGHPCRRGGLGGGVGAIQLVHVQVCHRLNLQRRGMLLCELCAAHQPIFLRIAAIQLPCDCHILPHDFGYHMFDIPLLYDCNMIATCLLYNCHMIATRLPYDFHVIAVLGQR